MRAAAVTGPPCAVIPETSSSLANRNPKTQNSLPSKEEVAAYIARAEARPAYKRAFAAQLAVFNAAAPAG